MFTQLAAVILKSSFRIHINHKSSSSCHSHFMLALSVPQHLSPSSDRCRSSQLSFATSNPHRPFCGSINFPAIQSMESVFAFRIPAFLHPSNLIGVSFFHVATTIISRFSCWWSHSLTFPSHHIMISTALRGRCETAYSSCRTEDGAVLSTMPKHRDLYGEHKISYSSRHIFISGSTGHVVMQRTQAAFAGRQRRDRTLH